MRIFKVKFLKKCLPNFYLDSGTFHPAVERGQTLFSSFEPKVNNLFFVRPSDNFSHMLNSSLKTTGHKFLKLRQKPPYTVRGFYIIKT